VRACLPLIAEALSGAISGDREEAQAVRKISAAIISNLLFIKSPL
jgi:hypothetical protein